MGMYRHDALPVRGSKTRESDRAPVDGTTPADYPLLAVCRSCNRVIRAEGALSADWKHTAAARVTGATGC